MSRTPGCLVLAALLSVSACGKSESSEEDPPKKSSSKSGSAKTATASAASMGDDIVLENHEKAAVAWSVAADGAVMAQVRTLDGQPITEKVDGSIQWKVGNDVKSASLVSDPKKGVLVAQGPRLDADLTELTYKVTLEGAPLDGALHLPPGGTAQLVADGKATAKVTLAEGARGPHGGIIQVVGEDRVEIVSAEGAEDVRVYVLNEKLEVVELEDRTLTIAVVGDKGPEVIVLTPSEEKLYFVGKWKVVSEPSRITVVVKRPGKVHVAIVGWRPGVVLVVGKSAPKVKVKTKVYVGIGADVKIKEKGGPGGVKIDIKEHKGKTKIKIK